jgi:hypothetical protein
MSHPLIELTRVTIERSTCIYFDLDHAEDPRHVPFGGFIAHILRVVTLWSLSLEDILHTSLCLSVETLHLLRPLYTLFHDEEEDVHFKEVTLHTFPCYFGEDVHLWRIFTWSSTLIGVVSTLGC